MTTEIAVITPPLFCQKCWDIGTSYRKQENEAQEVCDTAFEDIWIEWKKEVDRSRNVLDTMVVSPTEEK